MLDRQPRSGAVLADGWLLGPQARQADPRAFGAAGHQRVGLILLCGPYAQVSEAAVAIGLRAVRDRSKRVRFRALEMLAFSQRQSVARRLSALRPRVPKDSHGQLDAALAALEAENPNLFRKSLKLKPNAEIQWNRWAGSSAR